MMHVFGTTKCTMTNWPKAEQSTGQLRRKWAGPIGVKELVLILGIVQGHGR